MEIGVAKINTDAEVVDLRKPGLRGEDLKLKADEICGNLLDSHFASIVAEDILPDLENEPFYFTQVLVLRTVQSILRILEQRFRTGF